MKQNESFEVVDSAKRASNERARLVEQEELREERRQRESDLRERFMPRESIPTEEMRAFEKDFFEVSKPSDFGIDHNGELVPVFFEQKVALNRYERLEEGESFENYITGLCAAAESAGFSDEEISDYISLAIARCGVHGVPKYLSKEYAAEADTQHKDRLTYLATVEKFNTERYVQQQVLDIIRAHNNSWEALQALAIFKRSLPEGFSTGQVFGSVKPYSGDFVRGLAFNSPLEDSIRGVAFARHFEDEENNRNEGVCSVNMLSDFDEVLDSFDDLRELLTTNPVVLENVNAYLDHNEARLQDDYERGQNEAKALDRRRNDGTDSNLQAVDQKFQTRQQKFSAFRDQINAKIGGQVNGD